MKKPIEKLPVIQCLDPYQNTVDDKNKSDEVRNIDRIIEKINELVERVNYHTDNLK